MGPTLLLQIALPVIAKPRNISTNAAGNSKMCLMHIFSNSTR